MQVNSTLLQYHFPFITNHTYSLLLMNFQNMFMLQFYLLADPGKARGCSTFTSVINLFIHSLSH